MATNAQTEANRKNAGKSTGPRTEAGKTRTRRNATSHGLCSHVPFTSDEDLTEGDSEQFKILLADLREEHHPESPTEDIFVFKMAEHFWYGKRASWLLAKHLRTNEDSNEVDDNGKFIDNVKQVSLMLRYHTTADRGFIKNFNELRKLQKERRLEEIGSVSQNVETQPEPVPDKPDEAPREPEKLAPISVTRPDRTQVVLSYVEPTKADTTKGVQNYFARKFGKLA